MQMLRRFFAPKEIKAVLLALDIEEDRLRDIEDQPAFGPYAGFRIIKDDLRSLIASGPDAVKTKIREGIAPRTLVYLAIANHTVQSLRSGRYHIYRGSLSMPGQCLLSLWTLATTELEAAGVHSREEAIEGSRIFHQDIKDIG